MFSNCWYLPLLRVIFLKIKNHALKQNRLPSSVTKVHWSCTQWVLVKTIEPSKQFNFRYVHVNKMTSVSGFMSTDQPNSLECFQVAVAISWCIFQHNRHANLVSISDRPNDYLTIVNQLRLTSANCSLLVTSRDGHWFNTTDIHWFVKED